MDKESPVPLSLLCNVQYLPLVGDKCTEAEKGALIFSLPSLGLTSYSLLSSHCSSLSPGAPSLLSLSIFLSIKKPLPPQQARPDAALGEVFLCLFLQLGVAGSQIPQVKGKCEARRGPFDVVLLLYNRTTKDVITSDWNLGHNKNHRGGGIFFLFSFKSVTSSALQLLNEGICVQQYKEESASGNKAVFVLLY